MHMYIYHEACVLYTHEYIRVVLIIFLSLFLLFFCVKTFAYGNRQDDDDSEEEGDEEDFSAAGENRQGQREVEGAGGAAAEQQVAVDGRGSPTPEGGSGAPAGTEALGPKDAATVRTVRCVGSSSRFLFKFHPCAICPM